MRPVALITLIIAAFSMPETVFYDASGRQVERIRGPVDLERMRSLMNSIL